MHDAPNGDNENTGPLRKAYDRWRKVGTIRFLDEQARIFDRVIHRTEGGLLRRFHIDRHSPGVLILPALVCAWIVAASPVLSVRLLVAAAVAIIVFFATWLLMRPLQATRTVAADVVVQLLLVAAVALVVWFAGADTFQNDGLYRHVFVPIAGMLVISLAIAAALAPRLFTDLRQPNFSNYLANTELFADYGPPRTARPGRVVVSILTAPFRGPLLLLLLPAIVALLSPPYWLKLNVSIAAAAAFVALVFAGIDDRFNTMWKLLEGGFSRGGALIVSLAVILFAALRVAKVSYVTTVLDSAAGEVILFMLMGAYVFSWWFDYWAARLLSQQILRLIEPGALRSARIEYPICERAAATRVPDDGRLLQIHGASRFIAIRPPDPPQLLNELESRPPQVLRRVAEEPELRKITIFQAYRIGELMSLLANSGAPGGHGQPLPSQIMARAFSYYVLVAGAFILMAALGIGGIQKGDQLGELEAKTARHSNLALSTFLFNPQVTQNDRPLIALAASGGGTRAALYTASVLYGLSQRNLAGNVVLGSGISGGGAALAYFAANRKALLDADQKTRDAAWKNYFDTMKQPFIQDVLERASEWRIVGPGRLGLLLDESFKHRWNLPDDRQKMGQIRDFGLILNTSVAGHFDRADAQDESGPLIEVERRHRELTRSELAGGRLILTNMHLDQDLAGDALEGHGRHTLPIIVDDQETRLETAAALNANFPPVFSDSAVDVDEASRYWVTDGGAVDNRGMEMMLYAIRGSLRQNAGSKLPRLHVIVADASGYSNSFSQDRGAATLGAAGTKFASQLARQLNDQIQEIYNCASQAQDFSFTYLFMPNELRVSGSFGTHWMLQPTIPVEHDGAKITLSGDEMVDVIRCLYIDGCALPGASGTVLQWVSGSTENWKPMLDELTAKPSVPTRSGTKGKR